MSNYIDILFDGPPAHESGRFIEVEDQAGASIKFGQWIDRGDGYWVLRIPTLPHPYHVWEAGYQAALDDRKKADQRHKVDPPTVDYTSNPHSHLIGEPSKPDPVHPIVGFIEARIAGLDPSRYSMRIRWLREELKVGHLVWSDMQRSPLTVARGSLPAAWFHAASQFWHHPDFSDEWSTVGDKLVELPVAVAEVSKRELDGTVTDGYTVAAAPAADTAPVCAEFKPMVHDDPAQCFSCSQPRSAHAAVFEPPVWPPGGPW